MQQRKKALATWIVWLVAVSQRCAAMQQFSSQQQQEAPPEPAFLSLLAAQTAAQAAGHQLVHNTYNHSLPLPLLKNGLAYRGSGARLRRVISSLLHGESVHVTALGSSITYGRGVTRGAADWFTLFSTWLKEAFPAAKVTAVNKALPLVQSEHISACLQQLLDPSVALVFVEVNAADGYVDASIHNEQVHAFERLLRQLLKMPQAPAVVVLNTLQLNSIAGTSKAAKQQQQQQQQQQWSSGVWEEMVQSPKQQQQPVPQFYQDAEDHYGVVAQYYDVPWLSLRDAVWQGLVHSWPGLKPQELFAEVMHGSVQQHARQQQQQQQQHVDEQPEQQQHHKQPGQQQRHHKQEQQQLEGQPDHHQQHHKQQQQHSSILPNAQGHKCLADLAVGLLQHTHLQHLLRPLPPGDAAAVGGVLPSPMFVGNWEGHGAGCATGVDLRAAVGDEHKDWVFSWAGSESNPRWGWVTHTANATLVLQLDTRASGARSAFMPLGDQKVQLLQEQGMFTAGMDLVSEKGRKPLPKGVVARTAALPLPQLGPATAAAAAGSSAAWQGSGAGAAITTEAQRQAAAAALQLRLGQVQRSGSSERLVGPNQHSTLTLPPEARLEVAKTKTDTGIEVILPGGRRLQQQQQQQHLSARQLSAAVSSKDATAADGANERVAHTSVISAGNNMLVARTAALGPETRDSTNSSNSSASSTNASSAASANSSSSSTDVLPGGAGASILSEYAFLPAPRMVVLVGFLQSNSRMGRARIFCMSGCSCTEVIVDGWHPQHTHRLSTARVYVTQSPLCRVGVQVLPQSSSRHHKFRVTGVMVTQSVQYSTAGSEWAHQYLLHPELLGS